MVIVIYVMRVLPNDGIPGCVCLEAYIIYAVDSGPLQSNNLKLNPPHSPNSKTSPLFYIGIILGGFNIRGLGGLVLGGGVSQEAGQCGHRTPHIDLMQLEIPQQGRLKGPQN